MVVVKMQPSKGYLLGNEIYLGDLKRSSRDFGLNVVEEETVLYKNPFVFLKPEMEMPEQDRLDNEDRVKMWMWGTYPRSLASYRVDEEATKGLHELIVKQLGEVNPEMKLNIYDITGKIIAKSSDISFEDAFLMGQSCCNSRMSPIQAIVRSDEEHALYGMRLLLPRESYKQQEIDAFDEATLLNNESLNLGYAVSEAPFGKDKNIIPQMHKILFELGMH